MLIQRTKGIIGNPCANSNPDMHPNHALNRTKAPKPPAYGVTFEIFMPNWQLPPI